MAEMTTAKEKADEKTDLFHCRTDAFCLAKLSNGWTVSLVQNRDYNQAACALSDLIVSTEADRDAECKAPIASTIPSEKTKPPLPGSQRKTRLGRTLKLNGSWPMVTCCHLTTAARPFAPKRSAERKRKTFLQPVQRRYRGRVLLCPRIAT